VNTHHKILVTEDSRIESANKRLKAAKAAVDRAGECVSEAYRHVTIDHNDKLGSNLQGATKTLENVKLVYAKAVDASTDTIGTGSGRVMVLLPPWVAANTDCQ
jgi:hypothetical protein